MAHRCSRGRARRARLQSDIIRTRRSSMGWSDRTKMNLRNNIAAVTCLGVIALGMSVPQAQSGERFRGRLSRLPVDRPTAPLLTGSGEVTATLDGNELTITATFEGMSSPATVAHMHRARMGPARAGRLHRRRSSYREGRGRGHGYPDRRPAARPARRTLLPTDPHRRERRRRAPGAGCFLSSGRSTE